jgi:excisionase family DNA binding protein
MKTASEQLAEAFQRVIDEAIERALSGRQAGDVDVKMKEAGKMLGFSASYILRLCKRGDLGSTGTGHRRRIPMAAIEAFRKRFSNGARTRVPLSGLVER